MNLRYDALPMRVVVGAGSLSRLPDEVERIGPPG
jgi:hypothetical protein